jgi:amino acid transporter
MNATPRIVYGWARSGGFFPMLTRIDRQSGIPRPALWLTLALSIFWTLPFPSWEALIQVVSAALVLSYAVAPVTVAALRRSAPELERPFRVRGFAVIGPVSFAVAALIVYWSGWSTVSWLLGLQIVMFVGYVVVKRATGAPRDVLAQQVRSSLWLVGFYVLIMLVSALGTFGGNGSLAHPWDSVTVLVFSTLIYYWGAWTGLPASALSLDDDDE